MSKNLLSRDRPSSASAKICRSKDVRDLVVRRGRFLSATSAQDPQRQQTAAVSAGAGGGGGDGGSSSDITDGAKSRASDLLPGVKDVAKDNKAKLAQFRENEESTSLMGSLKRTMSLGRLNRKKKGGGGRGGAGSGGAGGAGDPYGTPLTTRARTQQSPSSTASTPHGSPALSLLNARLRSSRSHESLLATSAAAPGSGGPGASPASMHSIDLSAPDVQVKPVHSSVLGQGHCFHVATAQGSKYISCTTAEERDKWLNSLRRTTHPNEEHSRRSDSSLKLWVLEAKNVPTKKRYFCDILLDRTLYAQTSVKTMGEMLFWGEHFEFKNLPAVEMITVNLYREADKKKKKDKNTLVGYINLSILDIENRQMVERWITCSSGTVGKAGKETKGELPIIRLKARRQTVDILPLEAYQPFLKYLSSDYRELCELFEPVLNVKVKEDFAISLVHILQKQGKACNFLTDIVLDEISRLDDEHLTFRGNSIATKAMEAYMKLVGEKYLRDTLGDFINQMVNTTEDCEVDPTKVNGAQLLACQQQNLDMYAKMAWVKITNSYCYFPNDLREVFATLRSRCEEMGKDEYCDNLISGCIFLRFLCPAILYPSLFNLLQEYPHERASRNLTLVAKTLQTLANFTQFGGKEEFMTFMNVFIENEEASMKTFLHDISSRDAGNQFLEYDGYIDLGKELSVLHSLLLDCGDKVAQTADAKFQHLNNILNQVSSAYEDPTVGTSQRKANKRRSQIYDNLVHVPTGGSSAQGAKDVPLTPHKHSSTSRQPNMVSSSPTEVLIDMLRHCGESADDLPALANRGRQNNESGSRDTTDSSKGASKLAMEEKSEASQQHKLNSSWSQIVQAADSNLNGDYIDLIPFMDEDTQNSSIELEGNTTGSQVSIGPVSTVASSGYQSLSHNQSQSNSPVEAGGGGGSAQQENVRELSKSPIIQYQPPSQPLAFANPLFRHQQQQLLQQQQQRGHHHHKEQHQGGAVRPGFASLPRHHQGMTLSQARTVRRPSSDSSLSSEDGVDSAPGAEKPSHPAVKGRTTTPRGKTTSSDYQATIAPLKKLSQLSSSSSDESLNEHSTTAELLSGRLSSGAKHPSSTTQYQGHFVHSTSSNFISPPTSSYPSSGGPSNQSNSAMNGCSTFPRRHHRQQQDKSNGKAPAAAAGSNSEVSPPLPPREGRTSLGALPGVHSRSQQQPTSAVAARFSRQQSQPSANRPLARVSGGLTTNPSGHVQQRSPRSGDSTSSTSSPVIPPRMPHSAYTPSTNPMSGLAGPIPYRPSKGVQKAVVQERQSSQELTSSSSDSSPPSLLRSQPSSLRESSSAHSMSSALPWASTPSHSDSNSSISSLTKLQQRTQPVQRSDSSGSLGTTNTTSRVISQTPSDSNSSMSSGNNNNNNTSATTTTTAANNNNNNNNRRDSSDTVDNLPSLTQIRPYHHHSNPSAFSSRLASQSDSQIHSLGSAGPGQQPPPPSFLSSSKYSVVHPPVPAGASKEQGRYPPSRSMDLGYINKAEPMKRGSSTDTGLSNPPLSPMSPAPPTLPHEDSAQSLANAAANRRLSPQSAVHMGISSVQRKLQEQERTKHEYEQEVHVLRQQLLEAQSRLQQAEIRLLDHEDDTHKLMDEWRSRLTLSEEKMRRQQAQKDEQMKTIVSRLQSIEEELKKEQSDMATSVEHKQQVIEVQEHRIRTLDQANHKLLQALAELKGRAAMVAATGEDGMPEGSAPCNGVPPQKELAGFKTSSC